MKKFLFLGIGLLSLGTVFVLQAEAQDSWYSSRVQCTGYCQTQNCSPCATTQVQNCNTGCSGTSRVNTVYQRVRQVPTTNCSSCGYNRVATTANYYNTTRSIKTYRVLPVRTYRSQVTTSYYPRRSSCSVNCGQPTSCYSSSCNSNTNTVARRVVRPVSYTSSYPYNNASNRTIIINVN